MLSTQILGAQNPVSKVPLTGIALNFIRVCSVLWAVLLSICVINVLALTRLLAVIFVPKIRTLSTSLSLPSPYPPSLNLPTPVNAERLAFLLSGYTPDIVEFLSVGFCKGFPIHYDGMRESSDATNLNSALENPEAVDVKIRKELVAGRIAGPFRARPFHPFQVSPLGVVPWGVPSNPSSLLPKGFSINVGISADHSSVSYATIHDAIRHIKALGPGCFLAKTDVKNAFRIIPVRPQDYSLLGICVGKGFIIMIDVCPWVALVDARLSKPLALHWNGLHIPNYRLVT